MKLLGTLATLLLSTQLSAAVDVRFAGSCANGDFDAVGTDVEYFNLNLDLFNGQGSESAECVMTTTISGKRKFTINVSDFKAEGFAEIDGSGLATLFVNHRFNGQIVAGDRDVTRKSGSLLVAQRAIGTAKCGQDVVIRTKLTTKASNAIVFQDSAVSNTVRYKFKYIPCP